MFDISKECDCSFVFCQVTQMAFLPVVARWICLIFQSWQTELDKKVIPRAVVFHLQDFPADLVMVNWYIYLLFYVFNWLWNEYVLVGCSNNSNIGVTCNLIGSQQNDFSIIRTALKVELKMITSKKNTSLWVSVWKKTVKWMTKLNCTSWMNLRRNKKETQQTIVWARNV